MRSLLQGSHFLKRKGAALMLMLIILVIGAATLLVSSLSHAAHQLEQNQVTNLALAQAKEALIGYAITYGDSHSGQVNGFLPCPDNSEGNVEGSVERTCGDKDISWLGRLPWKKLGLPMLRDADGECLWYAVSGSYKNSPKTDLMNWDKNGQFEILNANGAIFATNVVAVIFAPGIALDHQNRKSDGSAPSCGGNYLASNYLDKDDVLNNAVLSGAVEAMSQFRLDASPQINDRMILITKEDIWNALKRRNDFMNKLNTMTLKVAECIANFGKNNSINSIPDLTNKSLPWPAPLVLSAYGDNDAYNDIKNLYAGRVPYRVDTSRTKSGNLISSAYLLTSTGKNCPAPLEWAEMYPWWDNWKDHLFYALGNEFQPNTLPTLPCGNCLTANYAGQYAAVVIFAGQKLSASARLNQSSVIDYLESRNAGNLLAAKGIEDYQADIGSSTFNDILYCIKQDLTVILCPY
jgi:type II secretory pathway pseudopilin PulG